MVLYKIYVFYSDMKLKMVATAGLSLTLDPMGKMFQNVNTMTCGGSHLGFPIGIKNRGPSNDHSWAVFGFNCPSGFREEAF
jgi:hypothetical protein